jgi:hypothetical protein
MDKKRKRKRSRKEMKRRKMNAEQPNNTSIICFHELEGRRCATMDSHMILRLSIKFSAL